MRRAALTLLVLACGCADQTAILVEVRSPDLTVPLDVDALRIEASGATGTMADETFALEGTWPYSVAVRPGPRDDRSDVTIRVTGLRMGELVVRRVVQVPFVSGETRVVSVDLTRDCLGVMCAPDVDCVAGSCVGELGDAGTPEDGGAETDAGEGSDAGDGDDAGSELDAGVENDAGSGMDAGIDFDAGVRDAGGPVADAGMDAGTDAGRDAGTDAGGDAGTDACAAEICNGLDDDCDGTPDDALACLGSVVISEAAATGPGGAGDEFVELYNRTPFAIDISGLGLFYRSATGATYTRRVTAPPGASIPGYGFYLITGMSYVGAVSGDLASSSDLSMAGAGGHVRITIGTTDLDLLGWGTAVAPEGVAIPALPDLSPGSYERKAYASSSVASMAAGGSDASHGNGQDTNNNSLDFLQRATRTPQNAASGTEPP